MQFKKTIFDGSNLPPPLGVCCESVPNGLGMSQSPTEIIRTNRWYHRIWFRVMERVVYCVYLLVCEIANMGLREKSWACM